MIDAPGQSEGHHQRRRHQVVGPHFGVDAAFKIAIAESTEATTRFFSSMASETSGQRAGVSDTGGAAVADDVEFEFLEIREQAGCFEIVANDFGSGRERSFHPGRDSQALFRPPFSRAAGRDHHRRIRSVGATGDGGDHHAAVVERLFPVRVNVLLVLWSSFADRCRAAAFLFPAIDLVCGRSARCRGDRSGLSPVRLQSARARQWKDSPAFDSVTRSCGRLGPARLARRW